ncbi:mitochondrial nicotinamide adenine dinucleotide transporter SLC25A51-like [Ylistrum balloti]|uniref:mitochondrial nicotinamide adenine dinucleotide transporter SLC25A51-like n=1 Tax=Ylistrum balloti TaxID=509963 RepID=UPI002905EBEA|nr:mitochondrial nicotinamide adenine dinucleotide transporter SLC25A51-like [Ylistrum balloti]
MKLSSTTAAAECESTLTKMKGPYDHVFIIPQFVHDQSEFVCGWGAALVNITTTFPINKVMFRQQLYGVRVWRAMGQLKKEGLRNLYRGFLPPLLQKTTSMSLMFGSYYKIQRNLKQEFPNLWTPINRSSAAIMAGVFESVLTPFERVQVLMQDRNYHSRFNNTIHAFKEVRVLGLKEFYRGQSAILYRNCSSNIAFFLVRDYFMEAHPQASSEYGQIALNFFSGAFLGAAISTACYPLNVVKVRVQSNLGGRFFGFWEMFAIVLKERDYSVRKLFRGVHVNYTRSFITWGINNAVYELLMKHIFNKSVRNDES